MQQYLINYKALQMVAWLYLISMVNCQHLAVFEMYNIENSYTFGWMIEIKNNASFISLLVCLLEKGRDVYYYYYYMSNE